MEELWVSGDEVEAVVLPSVGGRLHRLRVFGQDLLRTPDDPEVHLRDPFFWGSYVMAPWCNRIEAGPARVGRRTVALGSNFADGSAIHGQVYARAWEVVGDGELRISVADDGWPWSYEVVQRIDARATSLRMNVTLVNRSDEPMPAGIGLHPWFRRPVLVAIRGDAVYASNADSRAHPDPVRGAFDLRRMGEMAPDIDATWTHLADPTVELQWPTLGVAAIMSIESPTLCVVAASPGSLDAIAVEPQTHAPQGLRRLVNGEPDGLAMLDPGQALELAVELAFERTPDARSALRGSP